MENIVFSSHTLVFCCLLSFIFPSFFSMIDILVQKVTGEDRMRERPTLLSQEKEERATVTETAAPSLTNPDAAFIKVTKVVFFSTIEFEMVDLFLKCLL